ncbi:Sodium/hydrogen exchanger family-domain-containing protein [Fomitopsis serialis]|uniref:Sodium/hydrogen exchanger family-domain-containing protein n=1 Tax=Fomitopsis serialis TaxID=139415 RepID=UPI0020076CD2|nr:Sodium/hydrogen exchanger family-domain-containing protein [Neoantrodia serialis]KAH9936219.1 Sodium/hydrogen exchanger family-domain-containing protein [Neoantrodia serialis]
MSRFDMFEVSIPHIIYAALGAFVVIFGMFSLFIREKLYIGEACWAFLFGVVIGPYGANIFNPRDWGGGNVETTNTITLEFCRVVLAIGVFAIGVELPKAYMARHWKSLFFLLFPVMTWGWFVSAGLIYALIPGLNFLSSLAVAACLTPTDPILAAAVVGGKYADKHVPAHLRHLLAAESGCNDGAAFPFLFISLYLINDGSVGKAVGDWFLFLWLYQIILGAVLGAIIGFAFRHLMKFCERTDLIDRQSYVAQYVSLAMLTIGINTLLGSDDLLAAFSCGSAFAWDGFFNRQTEQAVFSSVIDLLFNIASFVFIGAWMPFDAFSDSSLTLSVWRLIVIAILVLLLRRLPIMIALYKWIPDVKTFREAIFSGHFGPMGVGAVFISTLAAGQLPKPEDPPANQRELLAASIQPIVAFMVLCSITIHGLSIPFFSLGRRVHSVTRTWSRHDTFGTFTGGRGAMPEWTTHTRQVRPGEEIVINRDREDAMERGVVPAQEDSVTEKEHSESSQERDYAETRRPDGTDVRDENAPDGDDLEEEWREGPHRILEKRAGPGEEVEVEVQRNFYGPEPTATDTVRVAEDAAEHVVGEIKQRVGSGTQELESIVENAQRNLQEGASHVEGKAREMEGRAQEGGRHFMSILQGEGEGADEADEGWMSDASDGGRRPEGKRRIKKPNRKKGSIRRHPGSHRGPQRSASIDQAGLSEAHKEEQEKHDAGSESPEERRGRNSPEPEGAVTPASSMRYPRVRHSRVDSIRTDLRSREQSPSRSVRSVRFADQRSPSGYNTPRIFSPSSPATPLPGSEAPSEDEAEQSQNNHHSDDSPRNVRFSLPDIRR